MITPETLKKEAERLKQDIFLQEAIDRIRKNALERLIQANPDDKNQIIAQQVRVKFCSEIFSELESMINSSQTVKRSKAV